MKKNHEVLIHVFILLFILLIGVFYNMRTNNGITGAASTQVSVQLAEVVSITLTRSSVDFGDVQPDATNDTLDNNPLPFVIENIGNTNVNISISRNNDSIALFLGTGGGDNSSSFQFQPAIDEQDAYDSLCSPSNWTNIPGINPVLAVCKLGSLINKNSVKIELQITVPSDEPAGIKSETLTFTAQQS